MLPCGQPARPHHAEPRRPSASLPRHQQPHPKGSHFLVVLVCLPPTRASQIQQVTLTSQMILFKVSQQHTLPRIPLPLPPLPRQSSLSTQNVSRAARCSRSWLGRPGSVTTVLLPKAGWLDVCVALDVISSSGSGVARLRECGFSAPAERLPNVSQAGSTHSHRCQQPMQSSSPSCVTNTGSCQFFEFWPSWCGTASRLRCNVPFLENQ